MNVALSSIEPDQAHQAFEELLPDIVALPLTEVVARQVDVQRAAAVAYTVGSRDAASERRINFEQLAAIGRYDLSLLDRLPKLALASWHARRTQVQSQFRASASGLPEQALRDAQAARSRMLRVVDYWLGTHPSVARQIEFLKTGSGHLDLANDLVELAHLYERDDLRAKLTPEAPHYLASDLGDARRLARALFLSLGLNDESELKRRAGLTERAWTLLTRCYREHRSAGQFLFQKQEDVAATYPSLVSAVRSAPARRPAERPEGEPAEGSEDESGGEPAEAPTGDVGVGG